MSVLDLLPEPVVSTEPVVVWRSWRLSLRRECVRLRPIGDHQRAWTPLLPTRAACGHRRFHRAPALGCRCGLYGAKDAVVLERTRSPAVIGTVALWGRIIEHELGYRAEFGYPQRLRLICPECFWRREQLGANATVVALLPRGTAVPLCHVHLAIARTCDLPIRSLRSASEIQAALLSTYAVDLLAAEARPRSAEGTTFSAVTTA